MAGRYTLTNSGRITDWRLGLWSGFPSGALTVISLSPTTTLEFGLAGATHPEGHGRITSPQPLRVAGQLAVVFRNEFLPSPGQRYDVISAPVQGVFGSYTAPPISPTVFISPEYRPDGVSLVTTDPTLTLWEFIDTDSAGLPFRFYRVFYQP